MAEVSSQLATARREMDELAESTRREMSQINEAMRAGSSRFIDEMNQMFQRREEMIKAFNESFRPKFIEDLARQASEHQARMQKMFDAMNATGRTVGALSQSLIDAHSSVSVAAKALTTGLQASSALFDRLNSLKAELPKTLHSVSLIAKEMIGEFEQDLESMHESGWWLVDEIADDLPHTVYRRALRDERTTRSFSKLMSRLLRENDGAVATDLKRRWEGYEFIGPQRFAIVIDAVDAHMAGKYTLSIPALLPQIEFFVKQVLAKKNEAFEKLKPAKVSGGTYMQIMHIQAARHFYTNILFIKDKDRMKLEDDDRQYIEGTNRHSILHGDNPDYADEGFSTKLILYLDKVFRLINGESR